MEDGGHGEDGGALVQGGREALPVLIQLGRDLLDLHRRVVAGLRQAARHRHDPVDVHVGVLVQRQKPPSDGARGQTETKDRAYHGVHGEVVVLRLQLGGVLVAAADLRVALEEHLLVVANPVEHLQKQHSRR